MTRLEHAIEEARRIRLKLVRKFRETDLGGYCGLASMLLADSLNDVGTLRHAADIHGRFCTPHVWNEVEGVILDLTATQFNDSFECDYAGEPPVFGVLVTREPRVYHTPVSGRGRQTLMYLVREAWYGEIDHPHLQSIMERLLLHAPDDALLRLEAGRDDAR